jgi:hypothetical protein
MSVGSRPPLCRNKIIWDEKPVSRMRTLPRKPPMPFPRAGGAGYAADERRAVAPRSGQCKFQVVINADRYPKIAEPRDHTKVALVASRQGIAARERC